MAETKINTQEELEKQLKEALSNTPDKIEEENLGELDLSEFTGINVNNTQYTTEVLEKKEEIKSTIDIDQYKGLIDYVLGIQQRPDFADTMLTQLPEKYEELVKIVVALNLLQLPKLYDYLRVLQENLLNTDNIKNMTYADMSTEATNLVKQINETLSMALKTATQLSTENRMPTKVEKLANALMTASESTRKRIEEILEDAQE
jgi:predicted transcriptional regulator